MKCFQIILLECAKCRTIRSLGIAGWVWRIYIHTTNNPRFSWLDLTKIIFSCLRSTMFQLLPDEKRYLCQPPSIPCSQLVRSTSFPRLPHVHFRHHSLKGSSVCRSSHRKTSPMSWALRNFITRAMPESSHTNSFRKNRRWSLFGNLDQRYKSWKACKSSPNESRFCFVFLSIRQSADSMFSDVSAESLSFGSGSCNGCVGAVVASGTSSSSVQFLLLGIVRGCSCWFAGATSGRCCRYPGKTKDWGLLVGPNILMISLVGDSRRRLLGSAFSFGMMRFFRIDGKLWSSISYDAAILLWQVNNGLLIAERWILKYDSMLEFMVRYARSIQFRAMWWELFGRSAPSGRNLNTFRTHQTRNIFGGSAHYTVLETLLCDTPRMGWMSFVDN